MAPDGSRNFFSQQDLSALTVVAAHISQLLWSCELAALLAKERAKTTSVFRSLRAFVSTKDQLGFVTSVVRVRGCVGDGGACVTGVGRVGAPAAWRVNTRRLVSPALCLACEELC